MSTPQWSASQDSATRTSSADSSTPLRRLPRRKALRWSVYSSTASASVVHDGNRKHKHTQHHADRKRRRWRKCATAPQVQDAQKVGLGGRFLFRAQALPFQHQLVVLLLRWLPFRLPIFPPAAGSRIARLVQLRVRRELVFRHTQIAQWQRGWQVRSPPTIPTQRVPGEEAPRRR